MSYATYTTCFETFFWSVLISRSLIQNQLGYSLFVKVLQLTVVSVLLEEACVQLWCLHHLWAASATKHLVVLQKKNEASQSDIGEPITPSSANN